MAVLDSKVAVVNANRDRRLFALVAYLSGIFIISRVVISVMQFLVLLTALTVFVLGLAVVRPSTFDLPLQYWMKMSQGIGKIVAPVTLGFLYFVILSPIALILKYLFNRDLMMLRYRESSWTASEEKNSQDFFERMY